MDGEARAARHTHTALRRRDRRAGIFELIRDVAQEWLTQPIRPDLPTLLTARLRHLLPVRSVRINELGAGPVIRAGQPVRAKDYVAFAVPQSDPLRHVVLEASFAGDRADDWSCQMLEAAASLATVLYEAERLTRAHGRPDPPPRDGAAPLVGSSLVMQGLRERVERVATTDFTVLIEGPIDP